MAHQPVGAGQGQHRHPQPHQFAGGLEHPLGHDDHLAGQGREGRDQDQLDLDHMVPQVGGEVLQHLQGDQQGQDLVEEAGHILAKPAAAAAKQLGPQGDQQLSRCHHQHHDQGRRQQLG